MDRADAATSCKAAIACRLNLIVSGGTGAGKTTLLNILSSFIGGNERVVTIEDAAELMLRQRHVVRLETRPANIEGKGAVRARELVVNALRMRPDRIIVGEVRSEEALDMLQAMNTGHDGSLTTVHANSQRDALYRLDTMVAMANLNIPERAIRQQIASAVNLIVQVSRMSDGTRKVTGISEITGMEGDVITMQDIFVFERTGIGPEGKVMRPVPRHRHPAEVQRAHGGGRACRCRWTCSSTSRPWPEEASMIIVLAHIRRDRRRSSSARTGCSSSASTRQKSAALRKRLQAETPPACREEVPAAASRPSRLSGVGHAEQRCSSRWAGSPIRCSAILTQAGHEDDGRRRMLLSVGVPRAWRHT